MIIFILAMDKNNLVGKTDSKFGMPWHYPEDLKFYKKMTTGKKNVMGRKTYEAIGGALPNRQTFVMTTNSDYKTCDAQTITSVDKVIQMSKKEDIYICGGVKIFELFEPYCDRIYLTRINKEYQGDVYFKTLNLEKYNLVESVFGENKDLEFQTWSKTDEYR